MCMWILQLRVRSKATEAGLMQGDEILAVNGYSCKDVSHERLMSLIENAGHYLDLDIVRYVILIDTLLSASAYTYTRLHADR